MPSNVHSSSRDMTATQRSQGPGMNTQWLCNGCHTKRAQLGSRGMGFRKLCAVCVAKKESAK